MLCSSVRAIGMFCLLLVTLLAGCRRHPGPAPVSVRPNILFFFSDDLRADAIGAYGHPVVQTPHIDSLVAAGFNFRRAYVMGSHHGAVCAPSRAMLLSGRQLFRVFDDLDSVATYPEMLRNNGYMTFATGKWHNSKASFVRSFEEGRRLFFGGMADHDAVPLSDLQPDGRFSEPLETGFSTDKFADAAIDFINSRVGDDQPFLAYVSFTAPHDPRTPPIEYLNLYPPESVPLPANYMPAHPFHTGWMTGRDEQLAPWPRTAEVIQAQLGEYYGLITHLDYQIGRILNALRRAGKSENTIVVFASDNGLALGSHGLLGKQSLYEHSSRVALLFAGPGIPTGQSDALVYLHDVFPTLGGLVQAPDVAGIDGLNLAPIWRGDSASVRPYLITAYEDLMRAIHDGSWKLIRYPYLHHTQLFDIVGDPHELHNLAAVPGQAGRVEYLMEQLQEGLSVAGDTVALAAVERRPMAYDYRTFIRAPDRWQPERIRHLYFE